MPRATTRRRFLTSTGAAAAAAAVAPQVQAAAARNRPNVVVLIVDTLRADHVYGDRAQTPNMDSLVRAGLRFTRCYPEAMPTVPARNSIFTGRRMFPFTGWFDRPGLIESPGWAPFHHVEATFTSALNRAGYFTAYVTDNPFFGFARGYRRHRRSFDRFIGKGGQLGTVAPLSSVSSKELRHWVHPATVERNTYLRMRQYLANGDYWRDETRSWSARVYSAAARLLDDAKTRQPFAMVVDTYEPHEPWTPPRKYLNRYGDPDYHGPEPAKPRYARVSYLNGYDAPFLLRRMHALYAAELTMTDHWIGVFLDRLHRLALDRNTVIVLIGDHGFQFGDHGWTGKIAAELHPPLTHVPLVIVHPEGRKAGGASTYFASTHDIGPTVLAMCDVRAPDRMNGVNLAPLFHGKRPRERNYAYGGYANYFYIRSDDWALMGDNRPGGLRLFDVRRDPAEVRNVASSHPGTVDALLGQVLTRTGGRLPLYPH
jgi:arylsulfatase A-like enzyme